MSSRLWIDWMNAFRRGQETANGHRTMSWILTALVSIAFAS